MQRVIVGKLFACFREARDEKELDQMNNSETIALELFFAWSTRMQRRGPITGVDRRCRT